MATLFTHAFTAGALVACAPAGLPRRRLLLAAAALSVLPDLDVAGFPLGVAYGHPFGHRGFTHSLLFAALVAPLATRWVLPGARLASRPWRRVTLVLFLATASHGVLDAFTDGGLGVGFLLPFDETRYFAPLRPLRVSPIGVDAFLQGRVLPILRSEILWVWAPAVASVAAWKLARRRPGPI
ncbi:MAG: metal-dependent hydrolase [Myxococcota bacterium]